MRELCDVCHDPYDDGGDGWNGLCPACADQVSAIMDELRCSDEEAVDRYRVLFEKENDG